MKKTVNNLIIIIVILLNIIAVSCLNDEFEENKKQEQAEINTYLQSLRNDGHTVIEEDGIYYVIITEGTGNSPTATDYIAIDFTGRKTDNTIIETTDSNLADDWINYQYLEHYVFGPKKIYLGNSIEGFYIGLTKMKEGGRNIIIIPSDLAYGDFVTLIYDVELLKVISDPAAYDSLQLDLFLAEQGIDTNSIVNNIYYNVEEYTGMDTAPSVKPSDSIYVVFDSYYLIENELILFESNREYETPLKFEYSESANAPEGYLPFTEGFLGALDTMTTGIKARAIVPYDYGYKETGYRHSFYGYIIVPAYTTLVYDIEIEDIIEN